MFLFCLIVDCNVVGWFLEGKVFWEGIFMGGIYVVLIGFGEMLLNKFDLGEGICLNFIGELLNCLLVDIVLVFILFESLLCGWWIKEDEVGFVYWLYMEWESCFLFDWLKLLIDDWKFIKFVLEWFGVMLILLLLDMISEFICIGLRLIFVWGNVWWLEKI